jgi:hypothetical protein
MAKNSIRDYSATNSSNTDIQSIDISEGCSPAGINNAIREVMADLKDVSTGAVALESPAMDSASLTGDLTFGDNDKAIFGAASDMQIYHDAGNSRIVDAGTGNLNLQADNNINILNNAGTEFKAQFITNGAVNLFYDNSKKLETTATGVDVTGTGTMDRLGLGAAAHASAALLLTTTNQHIRLDNGGELGVIELESNGDLNIWAHGEGETINLKTGSGAGADVLSVVGNFVGIGTSSPSRLLSLNSSNASINFSNGTWTNEIINSSGQMEFRADHTNATGSSSILFSVDGSENMRLEGGHLLLNNTTTIRNASEEGVSIEAGGRIFLGRGASSGGFSHLGFVNVNGIVGTVSTSGSSTAYNTTSDYRLKENVTYDWDATTRLKQLKPARFNFITDADTTVDGFLAHEVSHDTDGNPLVPEAITGTKDAMRDEEYEVTPAVLDDDGNEVTPAVMGTRSVPDYQGIDQSKLVPLLVKTIIELEARITALEAN